MMEPISPIVSFIKYKFMMTEITIKMSNGEKITGKVVDAFDNLVSLDKGTCIIYVNANHIVTFSQKDC